MPQYASTQDEYLTYTIEAHPSREAGRWVCGVNAQGPSGERVQFVETIDSVYQSEANLQLPQEDSDMAEWIRRRAVARARGAIATDRLPDLDQQVFAFEPGIPASRADDDVQLIILRALRRIRRLDPQHQGYEPLSIEGICLVEGVRNGEFEYNEQRLMDRGWAKAFAIGWSTYDHNIRVTEEGLQGLEDIERSMEQAEHTASGDSDILSRIHIPAPKGSGEYFVAHEFSPDQIDDLRRAIDEALEGSGLSAYYADGELRQGHILKDKILPKIRDTRFGIYDVSNPAKANVFLELGAGLALEKVCIIICKRGTVVPADLGGLDRIEYQSYKDLTSQLKDKLLAYLPPASADVEIVFRVDQRGAASD